MKRILVSCVVVLLVGCKKEDTAVVPDTVPPIVDTTAVKYDTVPIGSYFPVYPKSIWYYKDLKGNEVIHQTDSTYTLFSEERLKWIYLKPAVYVPKYDQRVVNKYELLDTPWPPYEDPWLQLLPPDIKKGLYVAKHGPNEFKRMAIVDAVDTSLVVNSVQYDSVIIVTYSSLSSPNPPTYAPYERIYFAKNIGIIKRTFLSSGTVSAEEVLMNYKIGKK